MTYCEGTTRRGTLCQRPAGWGTKHPGEGKCKLHGGASTGPNEPNVATNAVSHGAYADIVADQLQDSVFGAIPSDPTLETEMRIARYKLYRLLDSSVIQNIVAGFNIEQMEADEPTKITGITALISEIRKLSKEMQSTGSEQALKDFLAGVDTVRQQQAEDLSE